MKVAFIVPYPKGIAPSQRFRFEQQLESFEKTGIEYNFYPFLDTKSFNNLYKKGRHLSKTIDVLKGFLNRLILMFQLDKYSFVFIHREASPIGPPVFEWIITKVLRKKVVYDFDDAIWLPNTSRANQIISKLKWHQKAKSICSWVHKVSCGNDYLLNFAKEFNQNTTKIPTTVDTELIHNKVKNQKTEKVVVGWTGTHSTIQYLSEMESLLHKMQLKLGFKFLVISNTEPNFKKLKYQYIEWNKETEINDLLKMNIGIMPLKDNQWAKGKCGFKAIQYMSLGIPAIVSDVGVNKAIVENQINGVLCTSNDQWKTALELLVLNQETRTVFGQKAIEKIKKNYSKKSVQNKYLDLFDFPF